MRDFSEGLKNLHCMIDLVPPALVFNLYVRERKMKTATEGIFSSSTFNLIPSFVVTLLYLVWGTSMMNDYAALKTFARTGMFPRREKQVEHRKPFADIAS